VKRICKKCQKSKEYSYLCLNTQGRATYKDEDAKVWHGRICFDCHLNYVKLKANRTALTTKSCTICSKEFVQNSARHKFCCESCKKGRLLEEVGN
jgi:hypothetical protein